MLQTEVEILDSVIDRYLVSIVETYARYRSDIVNNNSIIKLILKELDLWRDNQSKKEHQKVVTKIKERIDASPFLEYVESSGNSKKWYRIKDTS
jgi:hypothetical protein